MKSFVIISAALLVALSAASGQTPLSCDDRNQNSFCELREMTLPSSGSMGVDTGGVGAITVQGWDNAWISVRARITTSAEDEYRARLIASSVEIDTTSNHVRASGPFGKSWAVAFEVYVPRSIGLELKTRVGAIAIAEVTGKIRFLTGVGAVKLSGLAGEVEGKVGVGAIVIALSGDHWDGNGIDVETGTGAIRISAASGYSARFDLRTTLGTIVTNMPGARPTAGGFLGRTLVWQSGEGGSRIQAKTSIGEIELKALTMEP